MAYRALYRTYRPRLFSEVVGQDHITTILKNQVAAGKLAHAYLFCGTRGTGKTSTAKILSRAVNCLTPEDGEPCGRCEGCLRSKDASCTDIAEIDAASNTSVDDVRGLIEQAQYAPLQLKMRVFIIDEVHMLSTSAFNALLKTLEEPPAHVLFILATTEPQKLPATILSRCQRFDFHRISVRDIVANVKSVLEKAGAEVDEEGLLLIARAADGGMRDALSLTDQCLAFCGDHVSKRDVYDVLGSMEEGFLFDMAAALLASDAATALRMLDGIVRGGRDLAVFCQDLSSHFRALLLAKTCGACEDLLDCTKDAMARYLDQAKNASEARLLLASETLLKAQGDMRYLASPRTMLESALVRICRPEEEQSLTALTARVDRLEQEGVRQAVPTPERPAVSAAQTPRPAVRGEEAPAAQAASAPPWEENAQARSAPARPAPETRRPEPAPERASAPAAPAPAPAAAPSGAEEIWRAVLLELSKQNILVHMLAKAGIAQSADNKQLVIGFPASNATQYNSVSAPINLNKLTAILRSLYPDMGLTLVRIADTPSTDDDVARAKAVFGDKLTIK